MVEINNQRKAFLDMLAWSEGTDNGRQKARNHGYDVIVGWAIYRCRLPSRPGADNSVDSTPTLSGSPVWCLPQQQPEHHQKVRLCVRQIERGTFALISVAISSGNRPLRAISELHCRALVMVSSSIRLTA